MRKPLHAVGAVDDRDYVEFWPAGAVTSGRFRCTACGNSSNVQHVLPRCRTCGSRLWEREKPPANAGGAAER
jgi:hypothetical protein